jgi:Fe-S cluster biogenesis protein NfuA
MVENNGQTIQATIEDSLKDISPMLAAAGRSVHVLSANETECAIELRGFCGDCACVDSYKEGIEVLVREKVPNIQSVSFTAV